MSCLKTLEKEAFEELLGMSSGYVLDFSNQSFVAFFRETASISIYDAKYAVYGDSKAKRLRAFWENESDPLVGKELSELIAIWVYKTAQPRATEARRAEHCRATVARLLGCPVKPKESESEFLDRVLSGVSLAGVRIDPNLVPISGGPLCRGEKLAAGESAAGHDFPLWKHSGRPAVGRRVPEPPQFNQASSSPKDPTSKVKPFQEWTLAQFIDVACDLGHLKLDVRKFSHALRDFRNYIHPFQQISSRFNPDRHTAEISLKAAIASLSGDREP